MIDLDGDSFPDVLLTDVDVPGSFCTNTFRLLQTTVDPNNPLNVTVREPIGSPPSSNDGNCAWNTNMTYDFAVLDIDGDGKPDLWSGHGRGNQVFLWELPSDCDGDNVPDRCDPNGGATPGGDATGACCDGFTPKCIEKFEACCSAPFDRFHPNETCATIFPCPTALGPQPGG